MAKNPTTSAVEKEPEAEPEKEITSSKIEIALKKQKKLGNVSENDTVVSFSESGNVVTVFTETASFSFERK